MIHELKCWAVQYDATVAGKKLFEIRNNDRGFHRGDTLLLKRYYPDAEEYSGEISFYEITWIERGPSWGLPKDMVVMGIKQIEGR